MKLRVDGVGIHYEIEGEGPVVTLSHALGCDLSMWDDQADALRQHYRVLRYDTRGHGKSDAPPGPYSLEDLAGDLQGLLAGLGISKTHFVGLSMGGMIGQVFVLAHPGVVDKLVLCDTSSSFPGDTGPVWEERIRTVRDRGMEALVEPTIERWFTPQFREQRRDVTDRVRAMLRSTPPEGYIGCCHAVPRIDTTERLGEIRCPTLVVVGEEDPGTPVAMARTIHEGIPSSRLAILPSASHLSNIEQAAEFNRLLLEFLRS